MRALLLASMALVLASVGCTQSNVELPPFYDGGPVVTGEDASLDGASSDASVDGASEAAIEAGHADGGTDASHDAAPGDGGVTSDASADGASVGDAPSGD